MLPPASVIATLLKEAARCAIALLILLLPLLLLASRRCRVIDVAMPHAAMDITLFMPLMLLIAAFSPRRQACALMFVFAILIAEAAALLRC